MNTHYEALGVPRNATSEQVKRAFRRKAMLHHPDRGGDAAEFERIKRAYDALSDPRKRAHYDEHGVDETEMDLTAAARSELCGLFIGIIDMCDDPVKLNLIATARKAVTEREKTLPEELRKLQRKIRNAESALSRLKHRGQGANFVAQAMHDRVVNMRKEHERSLAVLRILALVKAMISEYEYDFERADVIKTQINSTTTTWF